MFQVGQLFFSASRYYRKKSTDISWWQVKTVMLAAGKRWWAQKTGLVLRRSLHCCKSCTALPFIRAQRALQGACGCKQRPLTALMGVPSPPKEVKEWKESPRVVPALQWAHVHICLHVCNLKYHLEFSHTVSIFKVLEQNTSRSQAKERPLSELNQHGELF